MITTVAPGLQDSVSFQLEGQSLEGDSPFEGTVPG
jgi:hypothetical protein